MLRSQGLDYARRAVRLFLWFSGWQNGPSGLNRVSFPLNIALNKHYCEAIRLSVHLEYTSSFNQLDHFL